jgi:hypothetical protein
MAAATLALGLGACRSAAPAPGAAATAPQAQVKEAAMQEWKGQFSGVLQGAQRIIESVEQWRALWSDIGQAAPAAPDFKSSFAVAVFLGERNTGGYGVHWLGPASDAAPVIRYKETRPQGITMQVLTQPFAVKVFPRGGSQAQVEAAKD